MKPNIVKEGLKYGAICGLILILISYTGWAMGIDAYAKLTFWTRLIPYMIVIIILAGLGIRKRNGGILAFGDALKFAFLCYVVAEVLFAFSNVLLFNVIDKNFAQLVMENQLKKMSEMFVKFGQSQEKIDQEIAKARTTNQMSVGKIFVGLGFVLIWDFIISLLISLVIRKEEKFSD